MEYAAWFLVLTAALVVANWVNQLVGYVVTKRALKRRINRMEQALDLDETVANFRETYVDGPGAPTTETAN